MNNQYFMESIRRLIFVAQLFYHLGLQCSDPRKWRDVPWQAAWKLRLQLPQIQLEKKGDSEL